MHHSHASTKGLAEAIARTRRMIFGDPSRRSRAAQRRRRLFVAGVASAAALATVAVGSTGAYFTSSSVTGSQTGSASSLPQVGSLVAAKSGGPLGAASTVSWTAPTLTGWSEAGVSATPTYTVKRSLTGDFSAASNPLTLPTPTGTSLIDNNGGASFRTKEVTDIAGSTNGDGIAGTATAAVMGGKAYYWGKLTSTMNPGGVPTLVPGIADQVVKVAVGQDHGCALTATSRIFCFGDNASGQLGNGTSGGTATTAVEVSDYTAFNGEQIKQIGAGEDLSCALTINGTIGCWGWNRWGQVGVDGSTTNTLSPARVGKTGGVSADAFATFKPTQISVGPWGVCAIKGSNTAADGTVSAPAKPVACWGRSNWRQHGTAYASGDSAHSAPVDIPDPNGVLTGVKKIQVAHGVTCVLNDKVAPTNNVACWGGGGLGLLGDGAGSTFDNPATLYTTPAANGFTDLSVGSDTACAYKSNSYTCWGRNLSGQLGRGTIGGTRASTGAGDTTFFFAGEMTTLPSAFSSEQIVSVASGVGSNCVVTTKSGLACWGENSAGELGRGTDLNDTGTPSGVVTADGTTIPAAAGSATAVAKDVAASRGANRSYALVGDSVYYWGTKNETTSRMPTATVATAVSGFPTGISQLTGGEDHVCGLVTSGTNKGIYCAGGNVSGEVGDGTTTDRSTTAVKVVDTDGVLAGKDIVALSAGYSFTCALAADGTVACWGLNDGLQLGVTGISRSAKPVKVTGTEISGAAGRPVAIAAGALHVCAARAGGGVACWGTAGLGRLGTSGTTDSATPVRVTDASNYLGTAPVLSIAADFYGTCVVSGSGANTGKVYCWGDNRFAQLGTGSASPATSWQLTPITSNTRFTSVAVGTRFGCAWRSDVVECWGTNDDGWLGRGTTGSGYYTPASIATAGLVDEGVASLSTGWRHACAIGGKGGLYCWGLSSGYQTGQGAVASVLSPTLVKSGTSTTLAAPGTRYCLNGSALLDSNSCSLSPKIPYSYQVTYTVPNATNWVSPAASTTRY